MSSRCNLGRAEAIQLSEMYILASVFFSKKTINTYLKLEIRVACREFLAFKYVDIVIFETKQIFVHQKS